jgi:hypothetical protein
MCLSFLSLPQVFDMQLDPILVALEEDLRSALAFCVVGFVATARVRLEGALAEVAE